MSALLSPHNDSATVIIREKICDGSVCPVYNEEIMAEYRSVLSRPKFGFPRNQVEDFLTLIVRKGIFVNERAKSGFVFEDTTDAVFYETALSVEGTVVVTGKGRHFPDSPVVMSPGEFLTILNAVTPA